MVQNGKLAACAFALDRQLKSVDLPTLGKPTMPAFNAIYLSIFVLSRFAATEFCLRNFCAAASQRLYGSSFTVSL
jgi:hypothetical protein